MTSPMCERAIEDAAHYGKAILKFISANDVGLTGGHQSGFYLPKSIWNTFTPNKPDKGMNYDHQVKVIWPDGNTTDSVIKWYGQGTRSEYRLTRFGRDFIWRTTDNLGNMLVLIPKNISLFLAYVLDNDEDIEQIQAALGVEVIESWAFYEKGKTQIETEDDCLGRRFRDFSAAIEVFPEVKAFSVATRSALFECIRDFGNYSTDDQLIRLIKEEYSLYRIVERKIFQPEVTRLFASIDDFLKTALSILQARKSRAGRSLENHVEYLLQKSEIPYQMRQEVEGTRPDIIIPNKKAYLDPEYPDRKLFMIGVKMTCKDRWRQVSSEAPRIKRKHILTLQGGISERQLDEMNRARIILVVPESLQKEYPKTRSMEILSVDRFIANLQKTLVD